MNKPNIKYDDYEYYSCIKCKRYLVLPKGLSYNKEEDRKQMVCGLCDLEEIAKRS